MRKTLTILISSLFISVFAFGQQIAQVKSKKIESQILKQKRELLIYLPSGYNENNYTHYDVIYVFDSQNRMLFDYVHSLLGFLDSDDKEFIVVGITSPYYEEMDYARNNDMLPAPKYTEPSKFYNGYSGNADNFLDFIEKEAMVYIQENYRTLGNNIAVGHSLSASLVFYSMLRKPNMFNDLIAISPNFAFDNERLVEDILSFDYSVINKHSFLYTSKADEGIEYWKPWKSAYEKVQPFLTDSLKGVFKYSFSEFPKKNHWNTYPISIQKAFTEYFNYYSNYKIYKISTKKTEICIKVDVPNKKDKVYITGNQETLADWNPKILQMKKTSDYKREITIKMQLPAEFKFTRGSWETEALVKGNEYFGNIAITSSDPKIFEFEIVNWNDKIE